MPIHIALYSNCFIIIINIIIIVIGPCLKAKLLTKNYPPVVDIAHVLFASPLQAVQSSLGVSQPLPC